MRVAEENRLSSGITVAAVRQSGEEHIAYLDEQTERTEELIRRRVDTHPTLKAAECAARLHPRRRLGDGRRAPGRGARPQAVPERPPGGRLRRAGAARAAVGEQCQGAGQALEDRQQQAPEGALLPGRDGHQVQPVLPALGGRLTAQR